MGDPKFSRKKFETPSHPWEGERINEENEMIKKFGLKNKRELWKAHSMLKNFRGQARSLVARSRYGDTQAAKETKWLLNRLVSMGLLESNTNLDDVLTLDVEQILNRRLQTVAYHKGLAQTPKQARHLIVHGHIAINGAAVTIPSYFVRKEEEDFITYHSRSPLDNDLHPARPKPETAGDEPVTAPPPKPKKAAAPAKETTKTKAEAKPEAKDKQKLEEKADEKPDAKTEAKADEKAEEKGEKKPADAKKAEAQDTKDKPEKKEGE